MECWPSLTLRKGNALAQARANAVNATVVKQYYSLLETTLRKNDLFNCPTRCYSMDEDHKPAKVITLKGSKNVHSRTSKDKTQITILACGNAAGYMIPPMVIFQGKQLNPEWTKGVYSLWIIR